MANKYDVAVDPDAPNNAHSYMLDLVGWNRRVLELGAAAGHVTRALVERSCDVTAVECDSEAALSLKSVANEVIIGDLNDPTIFDGVTPEFDVLLAGDALEHLLTPQEVLNRAARLVKPGGFVVLSIPNIAHADVRLSLMLGKWDYRPSGLLDDGHVRFFTLKTVKELVRGAGLVITEMRRVRIPAFESELGVDRASVPTNLIDLVLADPEAETYQFVLSATANNGDYQLARLSDRVVGLERQLELAQIANAALLADHEPLNKEFGLLQQQLQDTEAARRQVSDEFDALTATKIFRYSRSARRLYGRILRRP
jgi:SAM-dependent methyltransferase